MKTKKAKQARHEALANELFPALFASMTEADDAGGGIVDVNGNPLSSKASTYADDFDIRTIMNDAEDPDTGIIRDLRIDDRDLAAAKNYYDYAFNIIGRDANPPWLIQMWIGLMLFAETCPRCSDKRWYDLSYLVDKVDKGMPSENIVEHLQLLENGTCPKCKTHKYELIKNYGLKNYQELVNVLGQRSGKSSSCASYSSYVGHRYLKYPNLAHMTNAMQKSTELTGTFVSLTFSKAFGLLWTPFINIIRDSAWFTEYHKMLDYYGKKNGIELFRIKDEFIKYFNKNLRFYPTHPNGNILRGDTRILAAIDELGLFPLPTGHDEEDEHSARANADEAHKSLTNSLTTVQAISLQMLARGYNPPPALMLGVSSPMSMRDKVMRLLGDSRTPEGSRYILGVNLPTWQVNPHIERDTPIIALAYARNAEKAERDFGANPPRVHSAFIPRAVIKQELFTQPPAYNLTYQYDQPGYLYGVLEKIRQVVGPSIVCVDAGSVDNSFCLTAAHFDFDTHKTVVSTLLELMPHDGRRIDFNRVYNHIIFPVCKAVNAVALFADQWQSLDILHRAKDDMGTYPDGKPKCLVKQFSPRRRHFDMVTSMLETGNLVLPFVPKEQYTAVMEGNVQEYRTLNGKPAQHLVLQMATVRDLGPGKAPAKGDGFTDDLYRTIVLTTLLHEEKVMERIKEALKHGIGTKERRNPGPVVVGRSGFRR